MSELEEQLRDILALTRSLADAVRDQDLDASRALISTRAEALGDILPPAKPLPDRLAGLLAEIREEARRAEAAFSALQDRLRSETAKLRAARQANESMRPFRTVRGSTIDVSY